MAEDPFVHIEHKVLSHDDVDWVVLGNELIHKKLFGKLDQVNFLQDFSEVDKEWQARVPVMAINFLLNSLNFREYFICLLDKFFLIAYVSDFVCLELVFYDFGDYVFKAVNYLFDCHIDFHFFKSLGFLVDLLDYLKLLHYFVVP